MEVCRGAVTAENQHCTTGALPPDGKMTYCCGGIAAERRQRFSGQAAMQCKTWYMRLASVHQTSRVIHCKAWPIAVR